MFSVRLVLTTTLPSSLIQKQQKQTHNPQIKIFISTRSGYDYSSLYSQYYGSNYPYSMATGKEKEKNTGKQNLTLDVPGFPGGAGGGFPSKGSDYPGGAASSYFNTYASYYSQTGAPYR